jgi:hypothetical protein
MATCIYIKHVLDQWKPIEKRVQLKVIYCFFGALLGRSYRSPVPYASEPGMDLTCS